MVKKSDSSTPRRFRLALDQEAARRRIAAARFGLLAATILVTIGVIMLAGPRVYGRVGVQLLISIPLFVGLYVVSGSRRVVALGVALMTAIAALGIASAVNEELDALALDTAIRAGLIAVVTGWLSIEVLRERNVSLDTILGGICDYLLLGYFYAHVYLLLEVLDPGALVSSAHALVGTGEGQHPFHEIPDLVYFSSSTLTTVAYGDIMPASAVARFVSMTEAMIGQLYPTIFIARLVSLNVAQMKPPAEEGQNP
jgi:hypothetical protein